jgi:hypothetical protein
MRAPRSIDHRHGVEAGEPPFLILRLRTEGAGMAGR